MQNTSLLMNLNGLKSRQIYDPVPLKIDHQSIDFSSTRTPYCRIIFLRNFPPELPVRKVNLAAFLIMAASERFGHSMLVTDQNLQYPIDLNDSGVPIPSITHRAPHPNINRLVETELAQA